MNDQFDQVDKRLNLAVRAVQDDLLGLDVPEFSPSSRKSPMVAAALLLVVVGLVAVFVDRESPGQVLETPPVDGSPTTVGLLDSDDPGNQIELVWGQDDTPPSSQWTRPDRLVDYLDPAYGTVLRRMTDAEGTRFDRNNQSRRQAENADGSLFMTYHGEAQYRIYDRLSGELVRVLEIHADAEPQWHPSDPAKVRHVLGPNSFVGDLRLYELDVTTGRDVVIADLTGRIQTVLPEALYLYDKAQGSPSADGDRFAWIVMNQEEEEIGIVSYDLAKDQLLGILDSLNPEFGPLGWVSASPTGTYVVGGFQEAAVVWDADLSNERALNQASSSGDLALQVDGSDAWVHLDFDDVTSPDAGWLVSIDLASLDRTRLFQVYGGANTSVQVSGKGYDKPGWIIASTYNCSSPGAWSCDKVMAVELGGSQRILNLAHTYGCGDDFWTEPQAVTNRDFTRVYFNSDAGTCGSDAEVYEITVPNFD